jgi:Protein of unknown function (DUF3570)
MSRPPVAAVVLAVALLGPAHARGEDRVSVNGAYFRETSTRVVQPMIEVAKDLPAGFDASAHFLVDAITSASIAAGTNQDSIFTELRKEVGMTLGKTLASTHLAVSYRQSREPDYVSHTVGLQLTQAFWDNTGTVALDFSHGPDRLGMTLDRSMKVTFAGILYTQALSPTLLAEAGYEMSYLRGYLANPYIQVPNLGYEKPPYGRLRHVLVARVAHYLPGSHTGLQLHYRFYIDQGVASGPGPDPWGMVGHTVEARVYQELRWGLELRLSYRLHSQGAARFWCNTDASRGGRTDCYGFTPQYYSADPKFGPLATHVPQIKLTWQARALARTPVLGWLSSGEFELSYAHYFQNTRYGGAHLMQTGYSLPF